MKSTIGTFITALIVVATAIARMAMAVVVAMIIALVLLVLLLVFEKVFVLEVVAECFHTSKTPLVLAIPGPQLGKLLRAVSTAFKYPPRS